MFPHLTILVILLSYAKLVHNWPKTAFCFVIHSSIFSARRNFQLPQHYEGNIVVYFPFYYIPRGFKRQFSNFVHCFNEVFWTAFADRFQQGHYQNVQLLKMKTQYYSITDFTFPGMCRLR